MSDKDTQPTNVIISPAWIRGIHIDGTQAKKQAVEIDGSANMYLFPNSVLEVSNLSHIPERRGQIGTGSIGTYEPFKLPLPGTPEFKIAAKAAVAGDTTETSKGSQQYEIRIPRKYIILPPAALRATKEFEEAIHSALQLTTDDEKFIGLQHVFEEFGYYYPYWITTGGRFLLKTSGPVSGTTKEIIEEAFKQELEWEASGGDLNLLYDGPDVHGWLESTATRQDLVLPLDVNAIYDLLEHEVNSEVQRIYKMKYYQPSPQDSLLIEMGNTMTNSLVRLSQTREKVGVAKGVHVSGLLSEEDVVELVNETDVTELMRPVSVAGKPRVECMVRCTIFGTNIVTHAFLPDDFLYGSAEDSGFGRAAMTHHVESNAGKIQPSTYKVRYLVMYVTYNELMFDRRYIKGTDKFKQAVTKALDMKSDMEKYQELQKVFKRFGYYYPSSISLGGRIVKKALPKYPSGVWSSKDGIVAINDAMMMDDSNNGIETIGMDEDGGHSTVTGCQNWIGSIQANQTRIQFRSLRPIYELLEDEQGAQIQRLYDENQNYVDSFPEIPKGLHFDGIEAEHQAIELTRDGTSSKMIMLRNFSNLPNLEHVKLYMKDSKEIENYLSLDIDTNRKLPGDAGFVAGSKGAYKERSHACESYHSKTKAIYDIAYVTYKELHLYDELIQPTKQFQQAVDKALLVGRDDQDTYYALQDVFQRFGYYYPTSVYIGGRIVLKVFLQNQVNQLSIRLKDSQNVLEKASEIGAEKSPTIVAIAQSKKNNHNNTKSKSDGAIIKVNQTISKAVVTGAIEKSLTKSERWNSIGGDSVLLLLNDVKGWMNTVKRSQTITKRRGIKPIYELLSEEQRHKVQQTYENVFLEDDRVRYDCMLELTPYDEVFGKEQESASEGLPISTEELFEKLLVQTFSDHSTAIEFCRNSCSDHGFSVIEQQATENVIVIYCSRGVLSECTLYNLQNEQKHETYCQWGVMLFENDKYQWQFRKLANDYESMHNHRLTDEETRHSHAHSSGSEAKPIIKLAKRPVHDQCATNERYVRYGDTVSLQWMRYKGPRNMIYAGKNLDKNSMNSLQQHERSELRKELKDLDLQWKIVPCSSTGSEGKIKSEIDEIDDKEVMADNCDYVRSSDIIVFESQAKLNGGIRMSLRFRCDNSYTYDCVISRDCTEPYYNSCRYHIRQIGQHTFHRQGQVKMSKEYIENRRLELVKKSAAMNNRKGQYALGRAYMYGMLGLDTDNVQALKYLELSCDQGYQKPLYSLGRLLWRTEEYQKALDAYEKATLYSYRTVYRELGNFYHTGFSAPRSTNNYTIPQNHEVAFIYFSIGGIFGDTTSALKIGEYYEKGHIEDFGIDHNKALRWYEYVNNQFKIPEATSAVGRIKHIMVDSTKDPSEKDKLRREAYSDFETVAMVDPYAKFMVALYNLNGWGCQRPDPVLGFNILLSLVETGCNMALHEIAKCYEQGIGVDCDLAKALAYQQLAAQMDVL